MSDRLDQLEARIDELRAGVRRAMRVKDTATARALRAELRAAERSWDTLVTGGLDGSPRVPDGAPQGLVTVREQAHQALTLLGAPAQPRLIAAVGEAFLGGTLRGSQLTSLRRDEERSFASSPYGRPYYLCAALTDRLAPARGLLTVSTWPLERRMVGPLSPRVDFLTCAIAVARHLSPDPRAARLLARMARNIPGGAAGDLGPPDPDRVIEAAANELAVHAERDTRDRADLAERATSQLDDRARLFGGTTLITVAGAAATAANGGAPTGPPAGPYVLGAPDKGAGATAARTKTRNTPTRGRR
ncbi:hypothetical protein [Nonomuraea lactucae]|uniref:hypothetical protein n=1 Tax=Nonomuraea lactucae TaxID=2249762 RepID=UPI001964E471|nr:hypothetical protein [Nonomuraea lactucae]